MTTFVNGKTPQVRTSDGFLLPFSREFITKSLLKETALAPVVYGVPAMAPVLAESIAVSVEKQIHNMGLEFLSGPLIRELVNVELLARGMEHYRKLYTRVGLPIYEFWKIKECSGFEAKENANLQPNPETIHKKVADRVSKEAALLLLPPHLADAHLKGDLHIHDLGYFMTRPFCQDWDLRYFFYYGLLPDGTGSQTAAAKPAQHAEVAILHAAKVLASAQCSFAGGQGFYGFTYLLAPYLRGLPDEKIKQLAQMMLYELSQAYVARGGQLVFSSLQIEAGVPKIWQDVKAVMAGKILSEPYGSFEDETKKFAVALLKEYIKGDAMGKMFPFPKPEVVMRKRYFDSEKEEVMMKAAELSAKFGSTYYDNLIPDYRHGDDGLSCYQCCAYKFSDDPSSEGFQDKLNFVNGAHFSLGAMEVVSINMPRLAYVAGGSDSKLFEELRRQMELAKEVLLIKRDTILKQAAHERIPFASQRPKGAPSAVDFEGLSLVIGTVGINEMVQHHIGKQLHEDSNAVRFAVRTIIEMEKIRKEFEAAHPGIKFAIARTPAESTAQTFAVADLIHHPNAAGKTVKGALAGLKLDSRDLPVYYTNGTHINVSAQVTLSKKMEIEEKFFPALSGGNIFHVWLGEATPNPEAIFNLNKNGFANSWIGYYAYTKDLSVCPTCGFVSGGLHKSCPKCNADGMKWYSRITGYYQDVNGWNEAKKQELLDRYKIGV